MFMNTDQREIQRKLRILRYAEETGQVAKTCRYFGIGRTSFYRWRQSYEKYGEDDHESLQWLYESAQRGFRRAQQRIAYMLSSGEFLEKNDLEAVHWLKRTEKNIKM